MIELEIFLNDGRKIIEKVNNYNATEMTDEINNHKVMMMTIGTSVLSKNIIRMVTPIEKDIEE